MAVSKPSTLLFWVLDAPPDWLAPRGLALLASERYPGGSYEDVDGLDLRGVFARFGIDDPAARALSWRWWCDETHPSEPELPPSVALVSMTLGARVPLSEVPRMMGCTLTREGLSALGFISATSAASPAPASPEPVLIDAPAAARLLGITPLAFRQRVQRGQIPRAAIVRTGRRQQFIRAKLPGLGGK
ncbi:MAG TPA: hypothetical protein VEK07_01640 [Polyangiaceae bacterium]|nr:hypothetical protein [Polyangiaceae bacterium]